MKFSILVVLILFGLSGCFRLNQQPSVLVIGIESLGLDNIDCDPSELKDMAGFASFCEESVRFTHAYTPSTMSQATWASLFTATFPFQHNVHNNGRDFLPASADTLAEAAGRAGIHTGFFSGGPPIFRKSGLSQGFEVFDDIIPVDRKHPYRSAQETFDHFLTWLVDDVEGERFFAAIHLADLQFPEFATTDERGEVRERSFSSQLRAVGDALGKLKTRLEKMKLWDSTIVILTGLNGPGPAAELLRQSTQVALFVKPARKVGQEPIEWKIDRSVSLVDVGRTLFDLLGLPAKRRSIDPKGVEVVSLANVLQRPDVDWQEGRFLVSESGWTAWRGLGAIKASVRQDPYLFVFDVKPKLFNTFVDNLESVPFPMRDPTTLDQIRRYRMFMTDLGYVPYSENPAALLSLEHQSLPNLSELERLGFWGLAARVAIQNRNWEALDRLGHKTSQVLWQLVARKNLDKSINLTLKDCGFLFVANRPDAKRDCSDRLFIALYSWMHEKSDNEKKLLQERFLSGYLRYLLKLRINHLNALHLFPWDTDFESAAEPTLTELFLHLPENKMYLSIVKSRSLKEDSALNLGPSLEF